jgi:hypothetical protein
MSREPSKTPRTAIEQFLLSQAVSRSLADLSLPVAPGATVAVEVAGFGTDRYLVGTEIGATKTPTTASRPTLVYGSSPDLGFVRDLIAGRLGELGLLIREPGQEATYRVRVLVHGFGTEQGETFFGMPPVQSVLLPFSLPELTLYKAQDQEAHIRYSVDVFDARSGRLVASTPWYRGSSYYRLYTVLLFIVFSRTDLPFAP